MNDDFRRSVDASDPVYVLVVDDEPAVAQLVADVVEESNFTPIIATKFAEFREKTKDKTIDMIILDLTMPDQDGVEYLRILADASYSGAVLLMSGHDTRVLNTVERYGITLGINIVGVMEKPIDTMKLMALITTTTNPPMCSGGGLQDNVQLTPEDLVNAFDNEELFMEYQPKIYLHDRKGHIGEPGSRAFPVHLGGQPVFLESVEALMRWRHPVHGQMGPNLFVPLAEQAGLMEKLTAYSVDQVMAQITKWQAAGFQLPVSVNYPPDLMEDLSIPDRLANMTDEAGIPRDKIVLEITETAAMTNVSRSMDTLSRLRLKDFKLSMDDFGTGFSSLIQLYRMPFSELKIDKSLVMDIGRNEEAEVIVRSTIELGHGLGLLVCAEGVETETIARKLSEMECDIAQGFLYSRPVSGDDILGLLRKAHNEHGSLT